MTFKEQCIALRKKDYSLGEIVKITGRPKTSVYAHIHSIPLSTQKWKKIRALQGAHISSFGAARKGKSARPYTRFKEWDANSIFIVSHILFDGNFNTSGFSYNNRSNALIKRMEEAVKKIYSFPPKRYPNRYTGVMRISYFNVVLRAHMEEMSVFLLKQILRSPLEHKRVFLQSFFDDEGCMDFRPHKNKRSVRGYQKNTKILNIVREVLSDFNIESNFKFPNEVEIIGKENLVKFQKEIGFSPGVRINGKRSNSIWKQSLEKREILRRAIASYKAIGTNGVHRKN